MTSNPHTVDARPGSLRGLRRLSVGLLVAASLLVSPRAAFASLLPPAMEDALAGWIALFVIFFVPVILIVVFWLVHVMPEKIAHKRHHPQFEAIRTLCLLSLRVRRAAVAAGLAVGVHEAGRLQAGLRHRQASRLPQGTGHPGTGQRPRRPCATGSLALEDAASPPASSMRFEPIWRRSRRGWLRGDGARSR